MTAEEKDDIRLQQIINVAQSNDLIQKARYSLERNAGDSLTTLEQKFFLYVISKIKPHEKELDIITISIAEFCRVIGQDPTTGDNYKRVKNAITKLKRRSLWLYDKETKTETTVDYIDKAKMHIGSGIVEIRLDEDLKPYLINLSRNFTLFSLRNVLAMKSKYSISLYQILKSQYFKGPVYTVTIEDLKVILDAENYKDFMSFKRRVLLPPLTEINEFSDLKVSVEYIKKGKAYDKISFAMHNIEEPANRVARREDSSQNALDDAEEWERRYRNVEKRIDPDQMIIDGYIGVLPL